MNLNQSLFLYPGNLVTDAELVNSLEVLLVNGEDAVVKRQDDISYNGLFYLGILGETDAPFISLHWTLLNSISKDITVKRKHDVVAVQGEGAATVPELNTSVTKLLHVDKHTQPVPAVVPPELRCHDR